MAETDLLVNYRALKRRQKRPGKTAAVVRFGLGLAGASIRLESTSAGFPRQRYEFLPARGLRSEWCGERFGLVWAWGISFQASGENGCTAKIHMNDLTFDVPHISTLRAAQTEIPKSIKSQSLWHCRRTIAGSRRLVQNLPQCPLNDQYANPLRNHNYPFEPRSHQVAHIRVLVLLRVSGPEGRIPASRLVRAASGTRMSVSTWHLLVPSSSLLVGLHGTLLGDLNSWRPLPTTSEISAAGHGQSVTIMESLKSHAVRLATWAIARQAVNAVSRLVTSPKQSRTVQRASIVPQSGCSVWT